jgi:cytochrome bd-type quinol oxidase subunit 2
MNRRRRMTGVTYLGTGVVLVLFIVQEVHRFDSSQLASPFFLLVPVFLILAVPLILGGATWIILGRSSRLDCQVRSATVRLGALVGLICLGIFGSANIVSTQVAAKVLSFCVPAGAVASVAILLYTFRASFNRLERSQDASSVDQGDDR